MRNFKVRIRTESDTVVTADWPARSHKARMEQFLLHIGYTDAEEWHGTYMSPAAVRRLRAACDKFLKEFADET